MREKINLPVAIPVWSLVCMLAMGIFSAGTLYNQMNQLLESSKKADERITLISEKQVGGLATQANIVTMVQNHEQRLTNVERALLEQAKK